jgi:hypothetical protein
MSSWRVRALALSAARRIWRELPLEEFAVSRDHAEEVVEVVGDAAREPPDGIHLLRLSELRLHPFLVGDVQEECVDLHEPALRIPSPRHVDEDMKRAPVRFPQFDLDLIDVLAVTNTGKQFAPLFGAGIERRHPAAFEVFHRAQTEHSERDRIGLQESPLRVRYDGAGEMTLEELTIPLLALAGLLGSPARRLGEAKGGGKEEGDHHSRRENGPRKRALESGGGFGRGGDAQPDRAFNVLDRHFRQPLPGGPSPVHLAVVVQQDERPAGSSGWRRQDCAKDIARRELGDEKTSELLPRLNRKGKFDTRVARRSWDQRAGRCTAARLARLEDRPTGGEVGGEDRLVPGARDDPTNLARRFDPEQQLQADELDGPIAPLAKRGAVALSEVGQAGHLSLERAAELAGHAPRLRLGKDGCLASALVENRLPEQQRDRDPGEGSEKRKEWGPNRPCGGAQDRAAALGSHGRTLQQGNTTLPPHLVQVNRWSTSNRPCRKNHLLARGQQAPLSSYISLDGPSAGSILCIFKIDA